LNAPTAAVVGHGLDKRAGEAIAVVVDVGGSALRMSVLEVDDGVFEVVEALEDQRLGGDAYTALIFQRIATAKGQADQTTDQTEMLQTAEQVKYAMSSGSAIESNGPMNLVSRSELIERSSTFIERTLLLAGFNKTNVDHVSWSCVFEFNRVNFTRKVIVTGASSKLPRIQSAIKEYFGKVPLSLREGKAEEAAARGAAIIGDIIGNNQVDIVGNQDDDPLCSLMILNFSTFPLGIETSGEPPRSSSSRAG
jgi:molecular chaperone DnaK (HSP70)